MSDKKYLYLFSEGNKDMREILGGKGANLAEMTNAGMPVPQGFTISTEACTQYYNDGRQINEEIMADIYEYIGKMEEIAGKKFGDPDNPLLVSVRSGARASMPGMMDTILNLGLNDEVVEGLAKKTGNPRFAYDSYRRFVQMFSDVVMEMTRATLKNHRRDEGSQGRHRGRRAGRRRHEGSGCQVQSSLQEKMGADFPTDPKSS
ncbi:MAG: PEP/pyruvate-binding domain-containing protein [Ruthenibacterium lactatiformans]